MAGETRSVVVRLSLDTAQAIAASKEFGNEFGRALDQADKKTNSTRASVDQLSNTTGKMALASTAALTAVIATTANFDEAMSHVAATGDDARGSLDQLREAAIQAGQDTAFSATEAAGGIENLAKAGVSAKDILGGGLSGALDLAAAGGLDVADAAEIAATALTQFKLQGADVPHVADLLAAAAGKAQGDVTDMSYALKQSGLVASQMGLSVEETTGTLAAFASAGLLGSDAGTSFRTMLLRLANPTGEARDLMNQLGIAAYDAQGNFVGMEALSGQLQTALAGLTQDQRDAALATLFGSDAIRAASVLYEQGAGGIADWTNKVNDSGYAAKTAATRMDNLKGDIEQLKGSLETAFIGAGEGSQAPLRSLVQDLTKAVNLFNEAPPAIQGMLVKLLAVTAITSGAAWFGSKVIRGVSDTRDALKDLGVTSDSTAGKLGKLGAKTAGILAVAAAVGAFADNVGRIDTEKLDASLTALGRGEETDTITKVVDSLDQLNRTSNSIDLGEIVTLGGLLGDTSLDKYADNVDQTDKALANLVESGNADQAADLMARIVDLAVEQGVSADEATSAFDDYALALRNAAPAAETAAAATGDYGVKARTAARATQQLNGEIQKSRKAAREQAEAFVGLGDSLDDSKTSLREWLRDLEKQAEALRNFRQNAEQAANKGLRQGLIDALEEAGPAGALRMKQLANATDTEIKRANAAWSSGQREVKRYTDAIGGVPTKVKTDVVVNTFDALSAVTRLKNSLAQVKSKDVYVNLHYTGFTNKLGAMANEGVGVPQADGGTVPGARHPYGDKTLIFAAPGEEVITNRNGQADRFRADRAAGRIPAYADGGTVGFGTLPGGHFTSGLRDIADGPYGFDLSGKQLERWAAALEKGLKAELTMRQRLLDQAIDAQQETTDAARDHVKAVRDDISSMQTSIANRFRSDVFGQDTGLTDSGLSAAALALHQRVLAENTLRSDIADARRFDSLTGRLNLHGAALTYAEQNASLDELQLLVNSPSWERTYQRLYSKRQQISGDAGQAAALRRYGDKLDEAVDAFNGSTAVLHRLERTDRQVERHLAAIEKNTKDAPERTGKVVGNKVNGAATTGRKGRAY